MVSTFEIGADSIRLKEETLRLEEAESFDQCGHSLQYELWPFPCGTGEQARV